MPMNLGNYCKIHIILKCKNEDLQQNNTFYVYLFITKRLNYPSLEFQGLTLWNCSDLRRSYRIDKLLPTIWLPVSPFSEVIGFPNEMRVQEQWGFEKERKNSLRKTSEQTLIKHVSTCSLTMWLPHVLTLTNQNIFIFSQSVFSFSFSFASQLLWVGIGAAVRFYLDLVPLLLIHTSYLQFKYKTNTTPPKVYIQYVLLNSGIPSLSLWSCAPGGSTA